MKCIVGLGNPGSEYSETRHNVGFKVIDKVASFLCTSVNKRKNQAFYGEASLQGEKIILVKPQTYMNNSGEAVKAILDYFKIPIEDLIVIYDDMDLPLGSLRLRLNGSGGGHNGVKSIINLIGTKEFKRIRIGIGKHNEIPAVDYVLGKFSKTDREIMAKTYDVACNAIIDAIKQPFEKVMTNYNQKEKVDEKPN